MGRRAEIAKKTLCGLSGQFAAEALFVVLLMATLVAGFIPPLAKTMFFTILLLIFTPFLAFAAIRSALRLRSPRALPAFLAHLGTFLFFVGSFWAPFLREASLWILIAGAVAELIFSGKTKKPWLVGVALVVLCALFAVFKLVIFARPKNPALESVWFVPHVVSYVSALVTMVSATILYIIRKEETAKVLVKVGWGFLTLGLVLGAIWAQRDWGAYWSWDPKETWALATWLGYLFFLHTKEESRPIKISILIICLILFSMSWWGVNYLPSAREFSVHVY